MTEKSHFEPHTTQANCEKHGDYLSWRMGRIRQTGCPTCSEEQDAARKQKQEARDLADRITGYLNTSGIQGRFSTATLETFVATTDVQRKVVAACTEFVDQLGATGSGLWLMGPPGTGKTHLGTAMCRAAIERRHVSAQIITARNLIKRIRATWVRGAVESEDDVIYSFSRTSLLVLDEVGVGFGTEAEQTLLFDVLDLRYQLQVPTVVLSNLQADQLKVILGDRIYDRLREGAQAFICDWASHRGPKA